MVQVQNKEGINPWHEFLQAFGSRKTHSYSLINKSITSKNVFHYITSHSPHPIAANTACTTLTASTEALCPRIDHTEVCTTASGCASTLFVIFLQGLCYPGGGAGACSVGPQGGGVSTSDACKTRDTEDI